MCRSGESYSSDGWSKVEFTFHHFAKQITFDPEFYVNLNSLTLLLKRQHVLFIDTCLDNWLLFDKHGDILSILRLIKGLLFSFCSKQLSIHSGEIGIVYISEKDVKLFHMGSCLGTKLALDLIFIQYFWRFFLFQFINIINWIPSNSKLVFCTIS